MGETCAVALILGGIYLIATKTISAAIPLSYIGTVAVLSLVLGQDVVLQLFSGGLLLGAFFMATDYVTSRSPSRAVSFTAYAWASSPASSGSTATWPKVSALRCC